MEARSALLHWIEDWISGNPPSNIWLGATVCNQAEADRDIPKLLAVPAARRFVSMEPLLGPIDMTSLPSASGVGRYLDALSNAGGDPGALVPGKLDWVICGGESGPNARPMHPEWARSLRDQCAAAGVPFLFKQWGCWRPPLDDEPFNTAMGEAQKPAAFIVAVDGTVHCFHNKNTAGGQPMLGVGKKTAGRLLDGRTHDEWPA